MTKYLFIDTNIWLSLYDYSKNSFKEFEKLKRDYNMFKLIITKQVVDEFWRNRDNKIKKILNEFKYEKKSIPNFVKPYQEYEELKILLKNSEEKFKELLNKIEIDTDNVETLADKVIQDFFYRVEESDEVLELAKKRCDKGNPPGKKGSYGDAINWECLLQIVPNGEDIYIVANDGDYQSSLKDKKINLFLKKEWEEKKFSKIYFYTNLPDFFKDQLQNIELEKAELISQLDSSWSFGRTHEVIEKLSNFTEWKDEQIIEFCRIFLTNTQISWISTDTDVNTFYTKILENYEKSEILKENELVLKVSEKLKKL